MSNYQQDFKDFIFNNKVGVMIEGCGLGDKIQYTHFPENLYKNFGIKLYNPYKYWFLQNNPYVIQDEVPDKILVLDRLFSYPEEEAKKLYGVQYSGRPDKHCQRLGLTCYLRHFNLYDNHLQKLNYKSIALNVGPGNSTAGEIPSFIVEQIKNTYKDFDIIQIGKGSDTDAGVIDKRGSSLDELVQIVRDSFIFIGVNSGPMAIANCYPNIIKKIVITDQHNDFPKYRISYQDFMRHEFVPQKHYGMYPHVNTENWLDFNTMFYNISEDDMGVTFSYKKI
jgi:hypothetical protein